MRMGRVAITEIEAKGILTPQKMGCMGSVDFNVNPYVGCAFGCSYCYVRRMQYGDDADQKSQDWGNWVKIKKNALALLQKSYRRLYGRTIFFGSATDPYQPIERHAGITRSMLEFLAMCYPKKIHIQTRSPLVARDVDVFLRFGDVLSVGVSLPTDNDKVRRIFEPSAPSIPQRLKAMEKLHAAGVRVHASLAPLLPCHPERLGRLIKGRAGGFWMDEMRYHWNDPEMARRYRENGWGKWRKPDMEKIREGVERGWLSQETLSIGSLLPPPSRAHNEEEGKPLFAPSFVALVSG
jgi:DNA repair photolyase